MKRIVLFLTLALFSAAAQATPLTPAGYSDSNGVVTAVTPATPFPVTFGASGPSVTLGTSASATNPHRSGDLSTGLFSSLSGAVQLACGAATQLNCSSVGVSIGTSAVAANPLDVKGAMAVGTYAGTTSGAANGLIVSGSVGIGTSSPLTALDVRGVIDVQGKNGIYQDVTNSNVAIGSTQFPSTVQIGTSQFNTAVGVQALNAVTSGGLNTAVGYNAGASQTTGVDIVAIGKDAFASGNASDVVAIGVAAGKSAGAQNVIIGSFANFNAAGAANSVIIGYDAGPNATGANNTIIGQAVGSATLTSGANNILIGVSNAIDVTSGSESNAIHIGGTGGDFIKVTGTSTSATETAIFKGNMQMPNLAASSAAQTGTVCWTTSTGNLTVDTTTTCLLSSRRFKKDIEPLTSGLDEIMKLRPVSFVYKENGGDVNLKTRKVGFIAEEVDQVDKRLVAYEKDGVTPRSVMYAEYTALLTKAIQEQQRQIDHIREGRDGYRCYGVFWCRD